MPAGRSRGPGGGPASGGVGPGRPSCGPRARRPARAGHSGDGSSCLATRGRPRDCSRRRSANARRPEAFPGRARPWLGSGPAAPGSGRAPRRWRGAAAVVPDPVARRVPGAGESAGPSRWHPRRGPVRDWRRVARTTRAVASSRGSRARVAASSACSSTSRATCSSASRISGKNGSTSRPIRAMATQPVMAAGQVSSLVRQDRIQLAGIERLNGAGGKDHRGLSAGDAVGSGLGMFHQHRPQGRLEAARPAVRSARTAGPAARRRETGLSR